MLIQIENASGTILGVIDSAQQIMSIARLSRAGEFSFSVPIMDRNISLLQKKRRVRFFDVLRGSRVQVGYGIIDETAYHQTSPMLMVTGMDILGELGGISVGFLDLHTDLGESVTDGLEQIIAFASDWSLDLTNGYGSTENAVYARFAGQSVLGALVGLADATDENFRLGANRQVIWLREGTPDSGIRAVRSLNDLVKAQDVCGIDQLEEIKISYELVTRIYPFGSGQGFDRLTLETVTDAAPAGYTLGSDLKGYYLERDDSIAEYGVIEKFISFKDISPISNTDGDVASASNELLRSAAIHLRIFGEEQRLYAMNVYGLERPIYPGQTIHVEYREVDIDSKPIDLNEDLIIMETTTEVRPDGTSITALLLSTVDAWLPTDAELIYEEIKETSIFEAYPQMVPNTDTLGPVIIPMDRDYSAEFNFWLGADIAILRQVKLRFKIQRLRSTVKTVSGSSTTTASGGGSTSGSGGGTTVTTTAMGLTTSTVVAHSHSYSNSTSTVSAHAHTVYGGTTSSENSHSHTVTGTTGTAGGHSHIVTSHSHDVTIPSHTHSTPDHTHTLTPNVSMTYGIFEESAGNTLALVDLGFKVNGSVASGAIEDIGSGWYAIDLTADLINNTSLRPTQEANTVLVETSVNKKAQLVMELTVRSTIQAIVAQ